MFEVLITVKKFIKTSQVISKKIIFQVQSAPEQVDLTGGSAGERATAHAEREEEEQHIIREQLQEGRGESDHWWFAENVEQAELRQQY